MKRHLVTICILLLASFALLAQPATLRIMSYASPPWFIQGQDGRVGGVAVDQVSLLAREAGFTPEFVDLPWTRALEYMKSGQLDMMLNLSKTDEREGFIHFLGVHALAQNVLAVRKEYAGLPIRTLDDLARDSLRWGIRQDMFYTEAFNGRLKADPQFAAHFEPQAKQALNLEKIRHNRLTGLVGDATVLRYVLKQHADEYTGIVLKEVPFFTPDPVYIGVSRQLPEDTIGRLQAAYDRLERRQAFEAILKKWQVAFRR